MATGSVSFSASTVEEPPLPGGRYEREWVTASFQASGGSVASATYSFQTSFGAAPSVLGGALNANKDSSIGNLYVGSLGANDFTFVVQAADGTNSSFTGKSTFMFTE